MVVFCDVSFDEKSAAEYNLDDETPVFDFSDDFVDDGNCNYVSLEVDGGH